MVIAVSSIVVYVCGLETIEGNGVLFPFDVEDIILVKTLQDCVWTIIWRLQGLSNCITALWVHVVRSLLTCTWVTASADGFKLLHDGLQFVNI